MVDFKSWAASTATNHTQCFSGVDQQDRHGCPAPEINLYRVSLGRSFRLRSSLLISCQVFRLVSFEETQLHRSVTTQQHKTPFLVMSYGHNHEWIFSSLDMQCCWTVQVSISYAFQANRHQSRSGFCAYGMCWQSFHVPLEEFSSGKKPCNRTSKKFMPNFSLHFTL